MRQFFLVRTIDALQIMMVCVGLKDGGVSRIYIDNPFPVELKPAKKEKSSQIVFISVNVLRTMVAVVEANRKLVVIELATQNSVYSAENVISVHFNSEVNEMLCFASEEGVTVVSGDHFILLAMSSITRC